MRKFTCKTVLVGFAFLFCCQQIAFSAEEPSKIIAMANQPVTVPAENSNTQNKSSTNSVTQASAQDSLAPSSPLASAASLNMPEMVPDGKNYLEWQAYLQQTKKTGTEAALAKWLKSKRLNPNPEISYFNQSDSLGFSTQGGTNYDFAPLQSKTFSAYFYQQRSYKDMPLYEGHAVECGLSGMPQKCGFLSFSPGNLKKTISFQFDAYKGTINPASVSQWQALQSADPQSLNGKLYTAASAYLENFKTQIKKFEPKTEPHNVTFFETYKDPNTGFLYCAKDSSGKCLSRSLKFKMVQNKNGSWKYAASGHNQKGDPSAPNGSIERQISNLLRRIYPPYQRVLDLIFPSMLSA